MKKNHDLHFFVEKDLKEKLQKEADERRISLAEYCREKLRGDSQLSRIESLLKELNTEQNLGKRSSKFCC